MGLQTYDSSASKRAHHGPVVVMETHAIKAWLGLACHGAAKVVFLTSARFWAPGIPPGRSTTSYGPWETNHDERDKERLQGLKSQDTIQHS